MAEEKRSSIPVLEATVIVLIPQRDGGEPYTTSEIISEGTGIDRRKVRDAIRKYRSDLEAFGRVAPYQAPLETRGGVQTITGYILNEQQATFLSSLTMIGA